MRAALISIPIVLLLLAGTILGQTASRPAASASKELVWHKYDEALDLAKKANKHVLVYFTTVWCGYCKKMKAMTFVDPSVADLMSNDFILAKVDGDSKDKLKVVDKAGTMSEVTEQQLTRAYRVTGYPATIFLKPDGTNLVTIPGFRQPDEYGLYLRFISTGSYEKMSLKEFSDKEKS
jgi:thioredoxin-related protein